MDIVHGVSNHSLVFVAISRRRLLRWLIRALGRAVRLLGDCLGFVVSLGDGRRTVSWRRHCGGLGRRTVRWCGHGCSLGLVVGLGRGLGRRTIRRCSHRGSLVLSCSLVVCLSRGLGRRTVSWRSHRTSFVVGGSFVVRDSLRRDCRTIRRRGHRSCLVDGRVLLILLRDSHRHSGFRLGLIDRSGASLARWHRGTGAVIVLRVGLNHGKAKIESVGIFDRALGGNLTSAPKRPARQSGELKAS